MGIKRIIKAIVIILLIVLAVYMVADNSKYVWKMFNTLFCESADNIKVYSVFNNVANKTITIKGKCNRENRYYSGNTFWTDSESNMYIGIKFNPYFGYDKKTNDFELNLPYINKRIKKVYIVNGAGQKQVWPSY